jgi:hypothetical protein
MSGQLRFISFAVLAVLFFTILAPSGSAQGGPDADRLVGPDKIFIRFTNTRPDESPVMVRINVVPNHERPFGWAGRTVYVDADGEHDKANEADNWLNAGQTSPWIDIGPSMNRIGARSPETYQAPTLCGVFNKAKANGLFITAEVAINDGGEKRITRKIEISKPDIEYDERGERIYPWRLGFETWNGHRPFLPTLGLLIPTQPQHGEAVMTLQEMDDWQVKFVREFPDVGRQPEQFMFTTHGRPEVIKALGYRDFPEGTVEANLGDEISIHLTTSEDELNKRFRAELKARGFDPLELMSDDNAAKAKGIAKDQQWEMVTVVPPLPDKPKQFYEQAVFRYRIWEEELAAKAKETADKNPGKHVLAGANFSPHMNVWPDVRQWINPFRSGKLNMMWSEDWWWQLPEISPQGYGYLLSAFRLGRSYHDGVIQFYIMPFKGNSQENFKRMNALALANGTTIFNHFHTDGQTLKTWDYIDYMDSPATYRTIHDVIRDWGAVEDRLFEAMPVKGKVAIMVSDAADTWDTEDLGGAGHLYSAKLNVNNDERKDLYLALRHAHIAVDLITDTDIAEGRLADYKVLYIVGENMHRAAAGPLKQWVEQGGVLYGTAGGGMHDEYRQPIKEMRALYGLASQSLEKVVTMTRPRATLPTTAPLQTANVKAALIGSGVASAVEALLYRDKLQAAAGTAVVANYNDRDPAITKAKAGQGTAIYSGALLGTAYVKPAATKSSQILPTDFNAPVRKLITWPVRLAEVQPLVTVDDPLVDAYLMENENGKSVVLIRWRDGEPTTVKVTIDASLLPQGKVRSLRHAGAFKGALADQNASLDVALVGKGATVTLPLETYDILFLD